MKTILLAVFASILCMVQINAQESLSPYFKVAEMEMSVAEASQQVKDAIKANGYEVIGEYNPEHDENLFVVCFTNQELRGLSLQFSDRGPLASVMKAGFVKENSKVTITLLNPEYMFLAYWGKQLNGQEDLLVMVSEKVKSIFKEFGTLENYGGEVKTKDLPGYHYMMMMPYYDDPDELKEFNSFEEGLEIIRKNLEKKKGNTYKVYEQVFLNKKIAVFGVALWDDETGEAHFLETVGEGHIANLPYEIILQDKTATMLAGKYRIALYWPELTMGTFMKIKSTPGEIEDTMEGLTVK
ncbi:MAG: hypothetical protein C0591_10395 [Marinilabiliales bacterium]|nr:MAG: hypothetical protein C0591_10395 [Marinilabiliales bacterium]